LFSLEFKNQKKFPEWLEHKYKYLGKLKNIDLNIKQKEILIEIIRIIS
jgi:hypothetical protein